jgi:hypothetical protein
MDPVPDLQTVGLASAMKATAADRAVVETDAEHDVATI